VRKTIALDGGIGMRMGVKKGEDECKPGRNNAASHLGLLEDRWKGQGWMERMIRGGGRTKMRYSRCILIKQDDISKKEKVQSCQNLGKRRAREIIPFKSSENSREP